MSISIWPFGTRQTGQDSATHAATCTRFCLLLKPHYAIAATIAGAELDLVLPCVTVALPCPFHRCRFCHHPDHFSERRRPPTRRGRKHPETCAFVLRAEAYAHATACQSGPSRPETNVPTSRVFPTSCCLRSPNPLALLDLAMDKPRGLQNDWGSVLDLEMLLSFSTLNLVGLPRVTSFIDKSIRARSAITKAPSGLDVPGLSVRCPKALQALGHA